MLSIRKLPKYIDERWDMLSEYVSEVCSNRDKSHGWEHMKVVAETAKMIVEKDFIDEPDYIYNQLMLDTITVAWLHDVADHKYDSDGKLTHNLMKWGCANIGGFVNILEIIKLVSYTSENSALKAGKPINYDEKLGKYYARVRHIVSDADKLEAIGTIGIERAILYTRHAHPDYTEEQIIIELKKHAEDKMLRLAEEFLRTETGKQLGKIKHEETKYALDRM